MKIEIPKSSLNKDMLARSMLPKFNASEYFKAMYELRHKMKFPAFRKEQKEEKKSTVPKVSPVAPIKKNWLDRLRDFFRFLFRKSPVSNIIKEV